MKTTLTTSQAASLLAADNNNGFSYSGAYALCTHLEQLESDCGDEMEFDATGIRCDYSEHESLQEWANDYFVDWRSDLSIDEDADEDEIDDAIRDYIRDQGTLIEFDGGIIVSSF